MLSATTADSRLSIAASIATAQAGFNSGRIRSERNSGNEMLGRPDGMPPNALPTVATGTANNVHATVVTSSATIELGIFFVNPGHNRMMANVMTATAAVVKWAEPAAFARPTILAKNSLWK